MRILLLPLAWLISSIGYGQKFFSEGTITYAVHTTVDGISVADGVYSVQQIKGSFTRVELKSPLGKNITLFNARDEEGAILQEYGSQKIMIPVTKENLEERNVKYQGIVFAASTESKQILEYNCNKASAVLADGTIIEAFYSKELVTDNLGIGFQFGKLPGLALEFTSISGNRAIKYIATAISFEPVPIQNFDMPSSGYRVMSFEESKKKK
jgi:GLPGLI family protein